MKDLMHRAATALELRSAQLKQDMHDDRGEGIISVAIAVLIMAFLGASMWFAFDAIWGSASDNIQNQVDQIGS